MASNLNSEFNYRYQVIGSTPWEKIKTLKGFLEGRKRAEALERVAELKHQAKLEEMKHLKQMAALPHVILTLEAEIIELESTLEDTAHAFALNKQELIIIRKLLAELYEIAEPTRIPGYTDDQMFEANANNEFTVTIGREIQAEIIANGRPSPAKLLNAMSNPETLESLKLIGFLPKETFLLEHKHVTEALANREYALLTEGLSANCLLTDSLSSDGVNS